MAKTGRYLYGLMLAEADVDFGAIGLVNEGSPGRVHTLRVDSLGAVVSDFASGERLLPLRKHLEPHNRVILEVMKTTTVIPMTFGHVARSDEAIRKTLRLHRQAIRSQLDRVDGAVEMGLKVKWDVENIFEHLVSINPELKARRDQVFGRSGGGGQNEKMELGKLFEESLNRERDDQTDRLLELLKGSVREAKVNAPKGEKMLMDAAFLVDRDAQKAFEARVVEVAEGFPEEYLFDLSGPWAPFHFVDLDLGLDADNG